MIAVKISNQFNASIAAQARLCHGNGRTRLLCIFDVRLNRPAVACGQINRCLATAREALAYCIIFAIFPLAHNAVFTFDVASNTPFNGLGRGLNLRRRKTRIIMFITADHLTLGFAFGHFVKINCPFHTPSIGRNASDARACCCLRAEAPVDRI